MTVGLYARIDRQDRGTAVDDGRIAMRRNAMKRMMMVALIALTMAGLFAANQTRLFARPSTTARDAMLTANQLYEAGHFAQAAQAYEQLADQGYAGSALFFNLGNAYFKQGDLGGAILNYRRAQGLDPRDGDIETNLRIARAQVADQLQAVEKGSPAGSREGLPLHAMVGEALGGWFTLNELAMGALATWILFMLLLLLFTSARKGSTWQKSLKVALAASALLLALGVLALGGYLITDQTGSEGVVVAAEVNMTSGPGAQYPTELALHGGAEIELVERRGSWVRLALPGGEMEGWVPAHTVASLSRPTGAQ
jgi:tetratricopeptide (TPR) repeat protein